MSPAALNDPATIWFDADADRIAEHLYRVQKHLIAHAPAGLSSAAMAERRSLLDTLAAYAQRGIFPMNTVLPGRTPVFIDDQGSACAVGYLMIASGHADLAEDIRARTDLAYVHDLHRPDVDHWAVTHGFTEDELAWIQPTYEFKHALAPAVIASLTLTNGDVLVVQGPVRSEEPPQMRVLRRSEMSEVELGLLPWLTHACAVECDGNLYIGGVPTGDATTDLYVWNGTAWTGYLVFPGAPRGMLALRVRNGSLFAVGLPQTDGRSPEVQLTTDGVWQLGER
jgi:hypothetical protein